MGEVAVCLETPTDGVMNDSSSKNEIKRDHDSLSGDSKPNPFPSKKQAKEASNEDTKSEVSNPIESPKENATSFQDTTTSHPAVQLSSSNPVGCGEVTSKCSENSSSEETPRIVERSDDSRSENLKSRIVLEIPEHLSSSGIRKITFKFTKRKEDYDNRFCTSVPEPMVDGPERSYSVLGDLNRNVDTCTDWKPECSNSHPFSRNMEVKMSKKVVPNNYPTNVKKLLATGVLDGARVKYISTSSLRELQGVVHEGGYLCGCETCNFSNVLSAYEFEQHSGAKTRHPNNHIYLENGRPIYSIIQELKTAPMNMLDDVIRNVAGSSINEDRFKVWKASFQPKNWMIDAVAERNIDPSSLCQSPLSCPVQNLEHESAASFACPQNNLLGQQAYAKNTLEERKRIVKKPSSYISNSVLPQKKPEGGIKRRDNDLHRLLFMPNGLPDGTDLAYYVKGQKLLAGQKLGNGILCSCCDREVSPSQFEAHAGMAARRQPYRHIYISTGLTLHDIATSLANGQHITTGVSDDMCTVCGDGGDLLLCGGCPRAYHPACSSVQVVPDGDWYCANCKDKYTPGKKATVGEVSSMDRPIVIRLTRVVKAPEIQIGGCAVCRAHDFSVKKFDDRTVILCDQCEKEYHVGCLRDSGLCDLKAVPTDKWFCCDDCSNIHVALQSSVSTGPQTIHASLSDIISRKYAEKGLFIDRNADHVEWRILNGKSRYSEHLPLLSRAAAIFRECFDPIVAKSGRDLIPVMVYGRNISGQEFGGMYCLVLTLNSVVVSAGLLRIFGRGVAELPLVATSREYQGKGYFQALFACIENLLSSLSVENLVLPAAEEAESIWTNKFGFRRMSEGQLLKYQREIQLTVFKRTSMLEKKVKLQLQHMC